MEATIDYENIWLEDVFTGSDCRPGELIYGEYRPEDFVRAECDKDNTIFIGYDEVEKLIQKTVLQNVSFDDDDIFLSRPFKDDDIFLSRS